MVQIGNDWDEVLKGEFDKPYYRELRSFLKQEYATRRIFPDMYHIFEALKLTPYREIKAVILGQDPYHEVGQAHGLCFSVQRGTKLPPSLVNIYKELESDLGIPMARDGDLSCWARQGVLLLNAALTVREGVANSHRGRGWEQFTDRVIELVDRLDQPVVFVLWGSNARQKKAMIQNPIHGVVESVHPSPLSAHGGFFGSRPFSRVNAFLTANGRDPIDWTVK